jgi:AraC family transcriptional regulator of arabinose operon
VDLPETLRAGVCALPVPPSPAAYFQGARRRYACAPDDILLFSRLTAHDLKRRSAESHLHRRFVLMVCLETAGTLSVDGIPFTLKPGRAHLVFPQSYHHFMDLERQALLWFMVSFESGEPQRLAPLRQRTITLSRDDFADLGCLMELFQSTGEGTRGDALSNTLSRLLCRLCEGIDRQHDAPEIQPARDYSGLWQRLQVELEALPPEELQIIPLARRLRISERHLRAKFRENYGVSLGAYLRNYRLRRAMGLLSTSSLSIAEIADRCGYQSAPAFHRAFQYHTGNTPRQFRQAAS